MYVRKRREELFTKDWGGGLGLGGLPDPLVSL